jgi:small subunit ribosomal protein S7
MKIKLKDELIFASKKQGESIKKKISLHRLANANRAFAHYRWF